GVFVRPGVVAFSGHVIDAPQRAARRFAAEAEAAVAARLERWVVENDVRVAIASVANGADILFLEAVRRHGGGADVGLPHPVEDFSRTSVATDALSPWTARCLDLLAGAHRTTILSNHVGFDLGYQFAGCVMAGAARQRAMELHGNARGLVVWDGL